MSTIPMVKTTNPLKIRLPNILDQIDVALRKKSASPSGMILVLGTENKTQLQKWLGKYAPSWQKSDLKASSRDLLHFVSSTGPVWIVSRKKPKGPYSHGGRLEESDYTWYREQIGSVLNSTRMYSLKSVRIEFHQTETEQELGALVGLGLASYSYKNAQMEKAFADFPQIQIQKIESKKNAAAAKKSGAFPQLILQEARDRSAAVNLGRHLVNTPPNFLNPKTLADFIKEHFSKKKNTSVEIWDSKRLEKEGMGLLLGVGQGAAHPPCLVRIKYRPFAAGKNKKTPKSAQSQPIAFVGKGISFDTGGLDIKPSAGMRLMKKDMGGAAAVLGLAQWAVDSEFAQALDFYLALAENSVDALSMRPSDVLTARNGMKVEIHNTDAEGRLVLADALDVAVTQKGADEPQAVIDVATLTGACRVALGVEIAGLFSNSDGLADAINKSGANAGDLNWQLPLYSRYTSGFSTNFGDMVNATDGMGGAITAALFLEKFVRNKAWAHLDAYAWNDKPTGSLSFVGGNGQTIQCLIDWLSQLDQE